VTGRARFPEFAGPSTYHAHPDGAQGGPWASLRWWPESGQSRCWLGCPSSLVTPAGTIGFKQPGDLVSRGSKATAITHTSTCSSSSSEPHSACQAEPCGAKDASGGYYATLARDSLEAGRNYRVNTERPTFPWVRIAPLSGQPRRHDGRPRHHRSSSHAGACRVDRITTSEERSRGSAPAAASPARR